MLLNNPKYTRQHTCIHTVASKGIINTKMSKAQMHYSLTYGYEKYPSLAHGPGFQIEASELKCRKKRKNKIQKGKPW